MAKDTLIFDTDVLIWAQRGNSHAATLINDTKNCKISIFTLMELLQGAKNKAQHKLIKEFLMVCDIALLPLTDNIGHRASIYIEEYTMSSGLRAGDALIAATAVENNLSLATSNLKHFKTIRDLDLHAFHP